MDCAELRQSLTEAEDGSTAAQQAHLNICPKCSVLVADLKQIASSACQLREMAEPSPRVWNAIEIVLRQEGLIHAPRPSPSLLPSLGGRWTWAQWLAPLAAVVLIAMGISVRQRTIHQQLASNVVPASVNDSYDPGLNDSDLLQEVSEQAPALQEQYSQNLRVVNDSIRDAKDDIAANPNDAEARRALMEAYQQKAMLFELAMDRSLP